MKEINLKIFDITTNSVLEMYTKNGEKFANKAPKGFSFTGEFRVPENDDYFLSVMNPGEWLHAKNSNPGQPRLILKRDPVTRYTFVPTGENRPPKKGEFIGVKRGSGDYTEFFIALYDYTANQEIFKLEVTEK